MKKTYHIVTIGCQMNISDSERIAAYLESFGFKPEPNRAKAGLVVLNTCGIRQKAEDRNYGLIPAIKKKNPRVKIILTGCLAERKDVQKRLARVVDIFLPIKDLPNLYRELGFEKVPSINLPAGRQGGGVRPGRTGCVISDSKDYLDISPKSNSNFSAYIPIGNGCDNFCSYCVVPHARGREVYRSAGNIIAEAKNFISRGYKEIILIAQNVNSYKYLAAKKDLKYFPKKKIGKEITFPELLEAAAQIKIPSINLPAGRQGGGGRAARTGRVEYGKNKNIDFWLRFFTSHPKNMSDELMAVMKKNSKICRQIHLPIQSGDDKILAAMNRQYTVKHYLGLLKKIRKAMPRIGISADIIVGFPGETKKQFANTEKLMRLALYDMVYLARFSPRPGTAAAKLKDNVPAAEKQRREEALNEILKKTAWKNNQRYFDKVIKVLVEEKNKRGEWLGKNEQFITVKIIGSVAENLKGKFVQVKITQANDFGLTGQLANNYGK
ncbi:MAG TPA: MiaB/RimO family radical SAM methylthiotransferase [Candidatus Nanoarchaeia archaeon]|nr:MiaB/RimO family radical SAM methylthiotransferase [Candidatus Nanoarchaeia archaeon]